MKKSIKIQLSSLYGTVKNESFIKKDYIPEAIKIINEYGINITELEVRRRWSEPHRYFHTTEHLNDVLSQIFELYVDSEDLPLMVVVAIFHDIIYDPQRKDNEEKCVKLLMSYSRIGMSLWLGNNIQKACELILATKTHDKIHKLIADFNKIDCSILDKSYSELLKWEEQIYKEYEFAGWNQYKERRIRFLELSIPEHMNNIENLHRLIKHIKKLDNIINSIKND